jgi:predicted dehydrogenase
VALVAVGSRDPVKAQAFAAEHGIPHAWGDYEAVASDAEVDVIYIATPHVLHHDNMLASLRGNKAVLCEKPFTLNAREAAAVAAEARSRQVFAMEAMWTRFLPAITALRELLHSGTIGRVQMIVGGGAFVPAKAPGHYLLDRRLGGGALLDAGVYLVSMASMILGTPGRILAAGAIGQQSGVDEQDAIVLQHPEGASALLYVSLRTRRAPDLEILGANGRIRIEAPIFRPARLTVWTSTGTQSTHDFPITGSGYGYQVREVNAALRAGRAGSSIMSLDETLTIMQTMDTVRAQIGLRYGGE